MTKNELMAFIDFINEEEKIDAEFYISVKGVELHRRILKFFGCDFSKQSKIEWSHIANTLRTDKATRDIIYKYLATLEEYVRAFISNKYEDDIKQNFWINGRGKRNRIKDNIEQGKGLFEVLENTEFGCLIQQVKNLPDDDIVQLFGNAYSENNLAAIIELRNAVSHHKFMANYTFKTCIIEGKSGSSLIDNIKNLRQLLPEQYRYGKNGSGGITAELRKIGIILA